MLTQTPYPGAIQPLPLALVAFNVISWTYSITAVSAGKSKGAFTGNVLKGFKTEAGYVAIQNGLFFLLLFLGPLRF